MAKRLIGGHPQISGLDDADKLHRSSLNKPLPPVQNFSPAVPPARPPTPGRPRRSRPSYSTDSDDYRPIIFADEKQKMTSGEAASSDNGGESDRLVFPPLPATEEHIRVRRERALTTRQLHSSKNLSCPSWCCSCSSRQAQCLCVCLLLVAILGLSFIIVYFTILSDTCFVIEVDPASKKPLAAVDFQRSRLVIILSPDLFYQAAGPFVAESMLLGRHSSSSSSSNTSSSPFNIQGLSVHIRLENCCPEVGPILVETVQPNRSDFEVTSHSLNFDRDSVLSIHPPLKLTYGGYSFQIPTVFLLMPRSDRCGIEFSTIAIEVPSFFSLGWHALIDKIKNPSRKPGKPNPKVEIMHASVKSVEIRSRNRREIRFDEKPFSDLLAGQNTSGAATVSSWSAKVFDVDFLKSKAADDLIQLRAHGRIQLDADNFWMKQPPAEGADGPFQLSLAHLKIDIPFEVVENVSAKRTQENGEILLTEVTSTSATGSKSNNSLDRFYTSGVYIRATQILPSRIWDVNISMADVTGGFLDGLATSPGRLKLTADAIVRVQFRSGRFTETNVQIAHSAAQLANGSTLKPDASAVKPDLRQSDVGIFALTGRLSLADSTFIVHDLDIDTSRVGVLIINGSFSANLSDFCSVFRVKPPLPPNSPCYARFNVARLYVPLSIGQKGGVQLFKAERHPAFVQMRNIDSELAVGNMRITCGEFRTNITDVNVVPDNQRGKIAFSTSVSNLRANPLAPLTILETCRPAKLISVYSIETTTMSIFLSRDEEGSYELADWTMNAHGLSTKVSNPPSRP